MNIILRDLPKKKVQIDLWPFDIHGGFRGFQKVPKGLHYVTTLHQQKYVSFWMFMQSETQVKVFDYEAVSFVEADNETTATFQEMADSGAMNYALIAFPEVAVEQWHCLSRYITPENFERITTIRALDVYNQNNSYTDLLAAYQWAFLKIIVVYPEYLNAQDMNDWLEWVRVIYAADMKFVAKNVNFYNVFLDLLILHLKLLPDNYKTETAFIRNGAEQFGKKIEQAEDVELALKAKQYLFSTF